MNLVQIKNDVWVFNIPQALDDVSKSIILFAFVTGAYALLQDDRNKIAVMRDDIFRRKEREKQAANAAAAAANVQATNNARAANNARQRARSPERKKRY